MVNLTNNQKDNLSLLINYFLDRETKDYKELILYTINNDKIKISTGKYIVIIKNKTVIGFTITGLRSNQQQITGIKNKNKFFNYTVDEFLNEFLNLDYTNDSILTIEQKCFEVI